MEKMIPVNSGAAEKIAGQKPPHNRRGLAEAGKGLEFSKHLMERINRRRLQIGPEETQKLNQAIEKAEAKGLKDSLVLLNDLAFIVSVQNRRVITAMDKSRMNEGVFTNIDSAIII